MDSICSKPKWPRLLIADICWPSGAGGFAARQRRPRLRRYHCESHLLWRAGSALVAFVLVVSLVKSSLLQSFYVPSASMTPTLQVDDCIIVPKLAYGLRLPFVEQPVVSWDSPKRGRVVVFNRADDPATSFDESARTLVKRVIGVAGDTITIVGAQVFVNGGLLEESYARWGETDVSEPVSFKVPDAAVFLLGDNRDESDDSRFWSDPYVPVARVLGPATAVYWSAHKAGRFVQ